MRGVIDRDHRSGPRRAISGPLTSATSGLSRSFDDTWSRSSVHVDARIDQIPKLIVRVRFSSPAPARTAGQLHCVALQSTRSRALSAPGARCVPQTCHCRCCCPAASRIEAYSPLLRELIPSERRSPVPRPAISLDARSGRLSADDAPQPPYLGPQGLQFGAGSDGRGEPYAALRHPR
jgi:hypothetical protein